MKFWFIFNPARFPYAKHKFHIKLLKKINCLFPWELTIVLENNGISKETTIQHKVNRLSDFCQVPVIGLCWAIYGMIFAKSDYYVLVDIAYAIRVLSLFTATTVLIPYFFLLWLLSILYWIRRLRSPKRRVPWPSREAWKAMLVPNRIFPPIFNTKVMSTVRSRLFCWSPAYRWSVCCGFWSNWRPKAPEFTPKNDSEKTANHLLCSNYVRWSSMRNKTPAPCGLRETPNTRNQSHENQ